MMKDARETDGSVCMVVAVRNDTARGNDLDWKWNKKKDEGEYHIGGKIVSQDSVFYYQDEDGFHALSHYKTAKNRYNLNKARILKGKIDMFMSNWKPETNRSNFNHGVNDGSGKLTGLDPNKPIGYTQGSSNPSKPQYFIRKAAGAPDLVTYGKLKEFISDNSDALKQYIKEFGKGEDQKEAITDWEKIKAVLDIYNQ